jgi:hypothetical protein
LLLTSILIHVSAFLTDLYEAYEYISVPGCW